MLGTEIFGIDFRAHDPTLWGWLVTGGYVGAAALAVAAGLLQHRRSGAPRRLEWFWYGLAVALVALAFNKQLDLQSYGTKFGARHAWQNGWYGERQFVQTWFIRGVFAGGCVVALALLLLFRRSSPQHWLAIVGVVAFLAFIAIRASSFHDVDILLRDRVGDVPLNTVLESGGILVVALAALWAMLGSLVTVRRRIRSPRLTRQPAASRR